MLLLGWEGMMRGKGWYRVVVFGWMCVGMWWRGVYWGDDYMMDVMLGIVSRIVGVVVMEWKRIWGRLKKKW